MISLVLEENESSSAETYSKIKTDIISNEFVNKADVASVDQCLRDLEDLFKEDGEDILHLLLLFLYKLSQISRKDPSSVSCILLPSIS